jgi:hypothetical protein
MSYKIPNIPSPRAYKEETADFWEVEAIRFPKMPISQRHITKEIACSLDEESHDGIQSEDDELDDSFEAVINELANRVKATNNNYPFEIDRYSLKLKEENSTYKDLYIFMLLSTRFNMTTDKVQNGIDATKLFERLCAIAIKNYFGGNTESFVFGTAVPGSFKDKVQDLIYKIGEGSAYRNPNTGGNTKNDDGLDIVALKKFSDGRIGKLMAFGQCKTGTRDAWKDSKHKANPEDFCTKWFSTPVVFTPLRLLFICDTMHEDGGTFFDDQHRFLVFNRFRIMEYLLPDSIEAPLLADIRTWLKGAYQKINIKA